MVTLHVVGAAIIQNGRCLVAQRGPTMALPGKWEFPGGKIEPGESPQSALVREIAEELALQISVTHHLATGTALAGARTIELAVYAAIITSGTPQPREHAQLAWATAEELSGFDWAEADVPCIPAVQSWLQDSQN